MRANVPELDAVPDAYIHEPWHWPGASRLSYPAPIVDNAKAARAAREALYSLRKTAAHSEKANRIADRHGSRKSGIPMTGRRAKPATKRPGGTQLTLDF